MPTKITVDADSRPHIITDGAGHVETITYDADDRIKEIAYTGTGTAKTVKFEYDGDGNVVKREDSTGTTKYTVDDLNRVTKEELPGSLSNSYEYDAASNMTKFTDGGGSTSYKYNGLNELKSMTEPGEKTTKFTYDNDHRLDKITYPSGAIEAPQARTRDRQAGNDRGGRRHRHDRPETDLHIQARRGRHQPDPKPDRIDREHDDLRLRQARAPHRSKDDRNQPIAVQVRPRRRRQPQGTGRQPHQSRRNRRRKDILHDQRRQRARCRQTISGKCTAADELSAYTYDGAGEELSITPESDTSGATFAYNAAGETSSITPSGGSALGLSYGGTGQDDLTAIGSSTTLQNSLLGVTREVNSTGTSYFARTNGLLIDERTPTGDFNPLYDAQGDVIALVNSSKKVERTRSATGHTARTSRAKERRRSPPVGFKGGYRMPAGNAGKGNVANDLYPLRRPLLRSDHRALDRPN